MSPLAFKLLAVVVFAMVLAVLVWDGLCWLAALTRRGNYKRGYIAG